MVKRPQKAPSDSIEDADLARVIAANEFVFGSPKLDGYRCLTKNGAFTSSLKPVTNIHIQDMLSDPKYNGLDGELIVGPPNTESTFNNTTGPVRRASGEPDFTFYVFDRHDLDGASYAKRLMFIESSLPYVHVVKQRKLYTVKDVRIYEQKCIENGFEGAMVRTAGGLYKPGRCTLREMNIFKRKPTVDDECVIIGFEEQMMNNNVAKRNELGNMVRSSHKANKVGKGTLGKFIVRSDMWKEPFAIGTGKGLTNNLRQHIWDNQEKYEGKSISYKFQQYGSINAPRQPIYKGFTDPATLTDY